MNICTVEVVVPCQIHWTNELDTSDAKRHVPVDVSKQKYSPNRNLKFLREIQIMFSSWNVSIGIVCRTVMCLASSYKNNRYLPTTQLVPALSATSAAFMHLERLPNVSWLMWVYPAGAKCLRKKVDFPRHGKPENTTSSVPAASGMICAIGGSSNGTASRVNFIFKISKKLANISGD